MDIKQLQQYLLGPIVSGWWSRTRAAEESKRRFTMIAKLCRQFFGSAANAMWQEDFRKEFFPAVEVPQFQVTLNKAFELVAVIGPSLYWSNPLREVTSRKRQSQAAIAAAMGMADENIVQQLDQLDQQIEMQKAIRDAIGTEVLKYTQNEQIGTLKRDVHLAINEALLTGLGLTWTQSYNNPATGEFLVETIYDSVDNLLIDPDSRDPDWRDAKWIACKHRDPVWVVERMFGYPPGYLHGRGTHVSYEYEAIREASTTASSGNRYSDMIEWVEVWSIGGAGARIGGVDAKLSQFFDSTLGDHVYLAITPNVPHPLNIPPAMLQNAPVEALQEAVRWRTRRYGAIHETWKDRRWPVNPLRFYTVPGSPWPMAVLGPGLGYLICMNLIMTTKLTQAWDRRRDIIAIANHVKDSVEQALRSDTSPAIVNLPSAVNQPIDTLVQYLQRGASQDDLLQWMEWLASEFQKATGLLDIYYGFTRTQARVSSDIETKNRAANVRPEEMQLHVVEWVQSFSQSELILASQYIQGVQLQYLLGEYGAVAWDTFYHNVPVEMLWKECECNIDAKDIQRPDKQRDLAGLQEVAIPFFQFATVYAQTTGDTNPMNAFMSRLLTAMDMRDFGDLMFQQMVPPSDPATQQLAQQAQQLEVAKLEADVMETQAKAHGRVTDTMYKQNGLTQPQVQQLTFNAEKHRLDMEQDQLSHLQEMVQNAEKHQQELKFERQKPRPTAGAKK